MTQNSKLDLRVRSGDVPKMSIESRPQINPDHEYRLTGVVSHLGDRANAGHYVADVCTAKGWRRYNDTLIRDGIS